jgi:hypothetical protein
MAAFLQKRDPKTIATLDQDATLVETAKRDALFGYQGFKSYQPLNTWWVEQYMVLHTEFRDGNVPAGYEQLRVLKESLLLLPEGVDQVRLRSDTAGYQHSLLRYCEVGKDRSFGRIEFAVGADVTLEFKKAVLTEVSENDWPADLQGVWRHPDSDEPGVGGGLFYTERDFSQQKCSCLSVSYDPGGDGIDGSSGDAAAGVSLSDVADGSSALQAVRFGDQHGLGWGEIDPLASGALREVGGGALGDEGGFCRGATAVGGFWGECRLVVDHDFGDELKHDHEASGLGRVLGISADEGDSVFVHQHSGPDC